MSNIGFLFEACKRDIIALKSPSSDVFLRRTEWLTNAKPNEIIDLLEQVIVDNSTFEILELFSRKIMSGQDGFI
jgi:hypothetical protein